MILTQKQVRDLLDYDPDTGVFYWKVDRTAGVKAGFVAGSASKARAGRSYWQLRILGRHYNAHRIAWLWMEGIMPDQYIDHAGNDGLNNRWRNLRLASPSQNTTNSKIGGNNTTGFKGVTKHRTGKFQAQVQGGVGRRYLGLFVTAEEASAAYIAEASRRYGEFFRSGHEVAQ